MMACLKRRRHDENHQGNVCFFLICFWFLFSSQFLYSTSVIHHLHHGKELARLVRGHDFYLQL